MHHSYQFIDNQGTFELKNPDQVSYLYFPLMNEAGLMSSVSPRLHGDIKTGQHSWLTLPISVEDLPNTSSARNFWIEVAGHGAWSATGCSTTQLAEAEQSVVRAGFLWHQVSRENKIIGLQAEVTNFIPPTMDTVELMQIRLTNLSDRSILMTPTAAVPIYGRSADNLRDHRHVTALLNHITCCEFGVQVCPTLSFDERGHFPNKITYEVLGTESDGTPPQGFFPILEDYIGEGGNLFWPEAVVRPLPGKACAGDTFDGFEAMGGLRFADKCLLPGESCCYILILVINPHSPDPQNLVQSYGSQQKFTYWLEQVKGYWQARLNNLAIQTKDPQFDQWFKWVTIQPIFRRQFGNSFLPFHDYGKGGRGWRDLWQDILALLVMETGPVDHLLLDNFAGVRLDGSNATIIGSRPGEFKADRNNIPRVWMDHGAWPLLTTQLYINQTGDLAFLLREQTYFKDRLVKRAQTTDVDWDPSQGTAQRTATGVTYQGTILEHLLLQHLTAFFNVGEHNQIKLEGADWNDGLDMAEKRGESVAFTAMYANNLRQLGKLVQTLQTLPLAQVELCSELLLLLDSLGNAVPYDSIEAKRKRLDQYFELVRHTVSDQKATVRLEDLAIDLFAKAEWLFEHIRTNEWISNQAGYGWFNGYYDNDGQRLEGDHPNGVRMTLTGQVFTLMGGVATDEQAKAIIRAVDYYLLDERVGGHRLNTDFKEVLFNMGRCFGFAFGHKENGAVFNHMVVMYAYALFERGFGRQAFQVLNRLYRHCVDFPASRMYPGIPEYFDARGRGVYPFLTGSASWYLLTILTQNFGVRGQLGDLELCPQMVREQFDTAGQASIRFWFAGRHLEVQYHNPESLDCSEYKLEKASLNGQPLDCRPVAGGLRIQRSIIEQLDSDPLHLIKVRLSPIKGN